MSGKQTEAAARGLALIAAGVPVRKAAEQVGLHPGTLSRAKKRAGMPEGKAGRPAKRSVAPVAEVDPR